MKVICPECDTKGEYREIDLGDDTEHRVIHGKSTGGCHGGITFHTFDRVCELTDWQAQILTEAE